VTKKIKIIRKYKILSLRKIQMDSKSRFLLHGLIVQINSLMLSKKMIEIISPKQNLYLKNKSKTGVSEINAWG